MPHHHRALIKTTYISVSNIQNPLNRRKQRRKLASTNEPVKHPSVSGFALVAITVNFIIGVGVLDLPHAFQDAGWQGAPHAFRNGSLFCFACVFLNSFLSVHSVLQE